MDKRKIFALTLALCLTGCGNKNTGYDKLLDKDDPVTITIWHYYNGVQQTNFDDAVREFNDTVGHDKGIIVEAFSKNSISELADSIVSSLKKDASAELPPDIFATYAETAFIINEMGELADVSPYFTDGELDEYVDEYIQEGRLSGDDSIQIFPTAKSTEVMMINLTDWQDFSDETGVTTDDLSTWEGIARTAEKYYDYTDALTPDTENDGKAFFGRDSVANYMNIGAKQLGSEFVTVDENGKASLALDETVVRRLWDNYYVPYVKGYYTAQGRYRSDDTKTGAIIALICSTTGAAYFPAEVTIDDDYTYPIENQVLPVPNFEGTEPYIVQQGAGMSVIKSDEKTEYASAVFLKWFTESERNIEFSIGSGYLPVKKAANNMDKVSEVNENTDNKMDKTMENTISMAIDELNSYQLYTAKPYEKSADVRDFLGDYIQTTADEDFAEACARIQAGESRDTVLAEYTDNDAFAEWYEGFSSGLEQLIQS